MLDLGFEVCDDVKEALPRILNWAEKHAVRIESLQVREPDMDDVFLQVTRRNHRRRMQ